MATYQGEILLDPVSTLAVPEISPNVAYGLNGISSLAILDSLPGVSDDPLFVDNDALVSPEPGISLGGEALGCFEELFEKTIISPRSKSCGFVLADVTWQTNLWNTHRNKITALTGVGIQDSGNVSVDNPLGYPLTFAPFQARDFLTIVPRDGDATIQAILTFLLTGESGTDVLVTGSRIVVFPAEPDWSELVKERTQYLTDILLAYSAKEQRVALRKRPRTHLSYRVLPTEARVAAALEALLYSQQSHTFGVPFWPDAIKITASTDALTSLIHCSTANRKFAPGGIVVLWRDPFTHEAATILSVAADSITTTAPLNNAWPADGFTYAIPVLTGRWDGDARQGHLTPSISDLEVAFQCDAAADVSPASPSLVYGYDVLEVHPNAAQDRATEYSRNIQILDFKTGPSKMVDRSGVALGRINGFLWTLTDRAEITSFRAWYSLRKGQQRPFWVSSWRHDLVQAATLEAGNVNLIIEKTGFTKYQFPYLARHYLCFHMLDGSGIRYYRKIIQASEGVTTETLVLSSALSASAVVPVGGCMISFLRLVRLATDEQELTWHSRDVAEAPLDLLELPLEVPA
jgi:hypothetical protein